MSFLPGGGGGLLGSGTIHIGADTGGIRGQVRQAVRGVQQELQAGAAGVRRESAAWNSAFKLMGMAAKVGFGAVVVGLTASAAAAISFEAAFAGVRKTVSGTPKELEAIRKGIRDLAKEIPVAVNELSGIAETAGALGIATKDIIGFTKVVAELGATTNVSSDEAATALGQLSNVLKLTSKDYERFGSTLVDLGNKGASTERQILDIASRSGAAGKLIGLTTPQILAFGSAVASLGIEAESGGSALQMLYLSTNKFIAKSGPELKELAKLAGESGKAFKQHFAKDAGDALLAVITGLGKLDSAGQQGALSILHLNNIRVLRAMLGLANGAKELGRQLGVGDAAWKSNTALTAAAEKRFTTAAAQLTILKNTIKDMLISLGDELLPAIKAVVHWLTTELPKAGAAVAAVWRSTIGPALNSMLDSFGRLGAAFAGVFSSDGSVGKGTSALQLMADALAGVAHWMGVVADLAANLLGNPVVKALAQVAAYWIAIRVALGGIGAITGKVLGLGGGGGGILSWLTFGKLGGGGGKGGTPLDGAADSLKQAARDLSASARAQMAGGAGAAGASSYLSRLSPIAGTQVGPSGLMAMANTPAARADAIRYQRTTAAAIAGRGAFRTATAAVLDGAAAAGRTVKAGGSALMGAASGALGLISRAFWPLMIGSLAVSIAAGPVGDIAAGMGFKRLGQRLKDDFFGGLLDAVGVLTTGTDAWVGQPRFIKVGQGVLSVMAMALSGMSAEQIDAAVTPTLQNGGYLTRVTAAIAQAATTGQKPEDTIAAAKAAGVDLKSLGLDQKTGGMGRYAGMQWSPEQLARIKQLASDMATHTLDDANKDLRTAVIDALTTMGFDRAQLSQLPSAELQKLGQVYGANIDGQFSRLLRYMTQRAIKTTGAKLLTSRDIRGAGGEENRGAFGFNVQGARADIAFQKNLDATVKPAQQKYQQWLAEVLSDPTGNKQATMAAGRGFVDQWGAAIEGATTKKAQAAIAKKLGMTFADAAALLKESKQASGQDLIDIMGANLKRIILTAARDGSKEAAPEAASILFSAMDQKALKAAADSPNTPAAKKLRASFAKWFPKGDAAGTAKGFKDAYDAWVAAGMLDASKPKALEAAVGSLPDVAKSAAGAIGTLTERINGLWRAVSTIVGGGGSSGGGGRPASNDKGKSASGALFEAWSTTHMTVGEAGRETVAVLRNPRAVRIADLLKSGMPGHQGPRQQLFVDNMHIQSRADEVSVLESLAFMQPAGR